MSQNQSRENELVKEFMVSMEKQKGQIAAALPKHMSAERMARLALTAFRTNKKLQECSMSSIMGSLMIASQLGLEPNVNGQGYLIPYNGQCSFVTGWKGLVDLVSRSGRATVWTGSVFEGDFFDYQLGDEPFCEHKPNDGEGEFTHVYAIGRVKDAQMPVIEVWTRAKVLRHLKKYNKVGSRHYANESEENLEMYARKVALLQVLKYMPSSIELSTALDSEREQERGTIFDAEFDNVSEKSSLPSSSATRTASIKNMAKALKSDSAISEIQVESFDNLIADATRAKSYDELDMILDRGRSLDAAEYQALQEEVNLLKEGI